MSKGIVFDEYGNVWAVDTGEARVPGARLIALTGYWCPVCHLPRTPYPGDHGMHPTCAEAASRTGGQQ
ncbi:hypothetical protein [Actinomyces ruminicola]|uniref:Uncharacterized protein n=1 Tax=Actinomyces ruminicola TaxID=332524 RepID=A0A1G9SWI5_9ACTO|nr:hypothetical protein [Actinomyces ruminicola]SDM39808.1 hypothetical protein SAMN04487766_102123 [Actinomyces ruminicola]SDN95372.1 hypothetical protein SAMN05216355_1336 [Actinomyces ruminicola]